MNRALELRDLYSFRVPSDPQLSPDGTTLAFTIAAPDEGSDREDTSIWTAEVSGGSPRPLTWGTSDSQPRWSPDGKNLAFKSTREGESPAPQIYLLPAEGGEARRLTDLPLGAGEPVWSPDGTKIALSAPVDTDAKPDLSPEQAAGEPIVVRKIDQKADGVGRIKGLRQHVFVVDVESGSVRQITTGDFFAANPVWSPDGSKIAFTASMSEDRDIEFASTVHVVPVGGGKAEQLTPDDGLLTACAWSSDGNTLLLTGLERLAVGHVRLFTVDAGGGAPVGLLDDFDRNVMTGAPAYPGAIPRYVDKGERVLFCVRDRGRVHIYSVASHGGRPELVVGGDRVIGGMSEANGTLAFVAGTWDTPGELHVANGAGERQVTDLFAEALPEVALAHGTERWFTAPDGTKIEGWVLRGDSDEPGPLLLDIHGGPHNAWGPAFDGVHLYQQRLVAEGWTILCINPRGSDGYGEAFWSALVKEGWGRADTQDFIAAIDELVEDGIADPGRIAVTGYSYGGLMTCWLTATTGRFASAVAGGSLTNYVSVSGTADAGWLIRAVELNRPSYDHKDLIELSPITHVTGVTAPTLLLHGANDDRCPVGQAEEWFAALRTRRVPTELVLYPGSGHLFIVLGKPSHRLDYNRRVEEWLTTHTAGRRSERRGASLNDRLRGFGSWFRAVVERSSVPAASIAILQGDDIVTAAAGVLNVDTGIEATTDSIFQIGSITKIYTTTLVMQLVDEGLLDLDAPIVEVLPEFEVADPEVTRTVTMRHLLTHTSGIEGDHFPDTGRGADAIERFVATCTELGQSHPLGATMSYCNTGFVVAGRIVERLTGKPWIEALQERLVEPLGLGHTVTLPEDAMRFRGAFGHTATGDGSFVTAAAWMLPWSCGPAGLICATPADVVTFAKLHLDEGRASSGKQVLSPESVRAMQVEQVEVPDPSFRGRYWGVGWMLFDWDGRRLIGHDGGTLGQSAFLRIVPEENLAVSMLTNGDKSLDLFGDVYDHVLGALAGISVPPPPQPLDDPPAFDGSRYVGRYERVSERTEITDEDGELRARFTVTGPLADLVPHPTREYVLHPAGEDRFVYRDEGMDTWLSLVFFELGDGTPAIHTGGRATPKVS